MVIFSLHPFRQSPYGPFSLDPELDDQADSAHPKNKSLQDPIAGQLPHSTCQVGLQLKLRGVPKNPGPIREK